MKSHQISSVPFVKISDLKRERIIRDYLKSIGSLAEWNGHHLHWWASNLSSKNRFESPVATLFTDLIRTLEALQQMDEADLILINPPWPIVEVVKNYYNQAKFSIHIWSWPFSQHVSRLEGQLYSAGHLLKGFLALLKNTRFARKMITTDPWLSTSKDPVFLIKSFITLESFNADDQFQDRFFGDLSQQVSKTGMKPLTIVFYVGHSGKEPCYQKLNRLQSVIPIERYLTYPDIIRQFLQLVWLLTTKPFLVKGEVFVDGVDISSFFCEVLKTGGWRISFEQYIHFAAGKKIGKLYKIEKCVLTYENNPWERMFLSGLKESNSQITSIGYQHSVVPQSATGMFLTHQELKLIPRPSIIFTTGKIPALIMQRYGDLPSEFIQPACALRYDYLFKLKTLPRSSLENYTLLVALEGVKEVVSLIEFTFREALKCPEIEFCIRDHPVLSFQQILALSQWRGIIPKNVSISKKQKVQQDIEACDAVLYWGTTVALEAIMLGRPVIHFDRGDIFSYDSAFELEDFKWTVFINDDLGPILKEIQNLSDESYKILQTKAINYVKAYFHPVNVKAMALFLNKELPLNVILERG
ncbi:hypothetical protein WDW89_05900 [Deltaproteobacteria bacterium TL4]